MAHTPTPWSWQIAGTHRASHIRIVHGNRISPARVDYTKIAELPNTQEDILNAKRIVACVNALEGIEDPQKHRETWEAIKQLELDAYHSLKERYDQLLEALESAQASLDKLGYNNPQVNNAIAKAKGGSHE